MENKANDMCPRCKHCLGMTPQGMYSCGYNNDGSELNIGVDVVLNCANFEWKDEKVEGRYPWGADDDKVLKYCANDVTIIAEQMAREKQKELEDKVEKYEKILIDILNETYSHPQLFEHNIHAYELIPGHIRFLRNSFNTMCDKYDPIFEENAKLKETIGELEAENAKLKKEIKRIDAQRDKMMLCSMTDDKRWDDLNNKFWLPLCTKLYGTTKVNKTYETILSDISDLKDRADGNYKAAIRKDELIQSYREKNKNYEQILIDISRFVPVDVTDFKDLPMIIEQMRKTGDLYDSVSESYDALFDQKYELEKELEYWKERCHKAETDVITLNSKVEVLDKRNTNQSVMLGEKGKEIENLKKMNQELQWRNDNQSKMIQDIKQERDRLAEKLDRTNFPNVGKLRAQIDNLKYLNEEGYKREEELEKKNRELQIRVNDLLKKIIELKDDKYRILKENEYLRNRYPTYSAMKAEDKIEHIQKEAKKWKNKYKEAYDILETYFKYDLDGMEYDVSYDDISLTLRYSAQETHDKGNKYNALVSAYERLKKL